MSKSFRLKLVLSLVVVGSMMLVLSGCKDEKKTTACCGSDPSVCCGKEIKKATSCCGSDPSVCCGKEVAHSHTE